MRTLLVWAMVCLLAVPCALAQEKPAKPTGQPKQKPAAPAKKPAKQPAPKLPAPTHAYVGARVHDGAGKTIDNAVILVGGGKIVGVGPASTEKLPAGIQRIELAGKQVIPGLIDAASGLFVTGSDDLRGSKTTDLLKDGIDLFDRNATAALACGVTSAHIAPSGSQFGGQGVLVKLRPDGDQTGRIAVPQAAVTATYVVRRGSAALPAQHLSVFDKYKDQLERATDYKESWEKYAKKLAKYKKDLAAWEKTEQARKAAEEKKKKEKKDPPKKQQPPKKQGAAGGQPEKKKEPEKKQEKKTEAKKPATAQPAKPAAKPKEPSKPKEDEHLAVLQGVLEGKRTLLLLVEGRADIESALRLALRYKIKLTLTGATEAHLVAAQLAKGGHRVLLRPPAGPDVTDVGRMRRDPGAAATLAAAGVPVAIGSAGSGRTSRYLRFFVSRALAAGLRPAQALQAVTGNAAQALGLAGRIGTLAPGQDADFVVLDGAPFALATHVEQVYIDGVLVFRRNK